jgi:acyl carrier protein
LPSKNLTQKPTTPVSLLPLENQATNTVIKKNSHLVKDVELNETKQQNIITDLTTSLAAILDRQPSEINLNAKFIDLGLDSIIGVEWVRRINKQYNLSLQATKLYDYPNVSELADFIKNQLTKNNSSVSLHDTLISGSSQNNSLEEELTTILATMLDMKKSEIDSNKSFSELGLDSIIGVEWVRKINNKYNTTIHAAKIYDYPNIKALAEFLRKKLKSTVDKVNETVLTSKTPISMRKILQEVQLGKLDIELADKILAGH